MSRTALTPQALPGGYSLSPLTLSLAAADNVNGNSFPATGREVLIAKNDDVVARTVTVESTADPVEGRTGDCVRTLAAGEIAVFPLFPTRGWAQADGSIYLDSTSALLKLAVVRLP